MSIIDTLITDRTQADVERWAYLRDKGWANMSEDERAEWDSDMKGSYNASDLNRVGEAMNYLAGRFRQYGYSVIIHPKTDYVPSDIPRESDMAQYLDDLRVLRSVFEVLSTTPEVPEDMEDLTQEEANDIERILLDINAVIEKVFRSFLRSGQFTFWSGYRPLPVAESDPGRTWAELDAMGTTWKNWQAADWYLLLYGNLQAEEEVPLTQP